MNIDKKAVGMRISAIRKENGDTQEEFGKKIDNASKSVVSKWERGDTIPNNKRLKIISDMAQTSVDNILYGNLSNFVAHFIMENYNVGYIDVSQISKLIQELQEDDVSISDLEEIKNRINEKLPIWKKEFELQVDKDLTYIRSHKEYKNEVFPYLASENGKLLEKFEDIFDTNYNFNFNEKVKFSSNIESIAVTLQSIIENPLYIFDTLALKTDFEELRKDIFNKDSINENENVHISFVGNNKPFPSKYNPTALLVNVNDDENCDLLKSATNVLVHYFEDLSLRLLIRYFLQSNLLLIDKEEVYLGYLDTNLVFNTSYKGKQIKINLEKDSEMFNIFPVFAIYY